jgi:hypothetical protein
MKPSEIAERIADTGIASEGVSGNCKITIEAGPDLVSLARAYLRQREAALTAVQELKNGELPWREIADALATELHEEEGDDE